MVAGLGSVRRAEDIVGLLDIGTSKTVCVVAAVSRASAAVGARKPVRVLGVGVEPSRGLRSGVVVELEEAEQVVRGAVAAAERAAGVAVDDVVLAVACGRLKSSTFTANTEIEGRVVRQADIERLTAAACTYAEREGRTLVHMNSIACRLDGVAGIADPLGLAGRMLDADMHAVTANEAPLQNLQQVAERAHLTVAGLVPQPYASALAATTEDERRLGVACVDMGAGTTSVAIFAEGQLLCNDVIAFGGNHVTFDIAHALSVPLSEGERIKKDYGTLARAASDHHEVVLYTAVGRQAPALSQTTKGQVREIVRVRMRGLLGHVVDRIERSGVAHYVQCMVLTGGASQQGGLNEFAADTFGRPVRVARIERSGDMPAQFCSPAFATAMGLVCVAGDLSAGVRRDRRDHVPAGYLKRMGEWLRDSF